MLYHRSLTHLLCRRIAGATLSLFVLSSIAAAHGDPGVSPQKALEMLKAGNARFVKNDRKPVDFRKQRIELLKGQKPFAIVLACSDSRVPPTIAFDESLGKVFLIRVAGNVADSVGLGSIEYAADHFGTQLIVVMGHDSCGAVDATIKGGSVPPNIGAIAWRILPAVEKARRADSTRSTLVARSVKENVKLQMTQLVAQSSIIRDLVKERKVRIVGAVYHLGTGAVEWLDGAE